MKNTIIAASLALTLPGFAFAENTGVLSTGGPTVVQAEPVVVAPPAEPVVTEARGTLPPYLPLLIAGGAALGAAALVLGSSDSRDSGTTTTTTTN